MKKSDESDDNMDFPDNYDDTSFLNDKSKSIGSAHK